MLFCVSQPKLGIVASGQSGSLDNNRISCSFKRVKQVNPSKEEFYDISAGSNYYILMATGSVSAGHYQLYFYFMSVR